MLRLPEKTLSIVTTIILSLAAAFMSVAFLSLTNLLFASTFGYFSTRSTTYFLVASFLTIMGSSLVVGVLLNRISPEAAGSGIPQLKAAYWKEMGHVPIRPVLVKFLAGVISIGGGTSLGREGPTVFMGGGVSSWLSGYLGFPKRERRGPALIGASSGLAAAFNTPLASITFVLEEIVGDFSSRSIGRVLISAIVGAFTVYALLGRQPAFLVPALDQVSWVHYLLAPIVALAASYLGIVFHRRAIALRGRLRGQRLLPAWMMPMAGGLITWCIGSGVYLLTGKLGVFSLGYQDLSSVLRNDFVWWTAGLLVLGKLAATIFSYSFGGCGGIFSPLLFVGGLCGYFMGSVVSFWIPMTPSDLIVLAAVGMSCCLGTVVKAPLSALLIVFEMTHQFSMVPALLIGMAVSMTVSKLTGSENFYEAILVQDGHDIHKVKPPLDLTGWQSQPISVIAQNKPTVITSLEPSGLRAVLAGCQYQCFPLLVDGMLLGILTRRGIEAALSGGVDPEVIRAITCTPEQSVREVADRLIDSTEGFVVLVDDKSGATRGIVTLHDILRAQAALSD